MDQGASATEAIGSNRSLIQWGRFAGRRRAGL